MCMKKAIILLLSIMMLGVVGCDSKVTDKNKEPETLGEALDIVDKTLDELGIKDDSKKNPYADKLYFKSIDQLYFEYKGEKIQVNKGVNQCLNSLKELTQIDEYLEGVNQKSVRIQEKGDNGFFLRVKFDDVKENNQEEFVPLSSGYIETIYIESNVVTFPGGVKIGDTKEDVLDKWGYPGVYRYDNPQLNTDKENLDYLDEFAYALKVPEDKLPDGESVLYYEVRVYFEGNKVNRIAFSLD